MRPDRSGAAEVRRPYGVWAVCALLLLAVALVFAQTAAFEFINYDDPEYVFNNPHILQGLSGAGIAWAFTCRDVSAQWQPLTLLSLMADAELLKPAQGPPDLARLAAWMHLVNVGLHTANALLLFLLLRAMTGATWPSALVAAVFAVHPLHVESVAWITERKDVLSGFFGLLSLATYAWYARSPSVVRYAAVAGVLTLGLLCKPMLVTWPFVFLLLDYWPLQRAWSREQITAVNGSGQQGQCAPGSYSMLGLVVEKVPLLLLVAVFAAVAFLAQRAYGSTASLESLPLSARTAHAVVLYATYLGKTLWPARLAAIYPPGPVPARWVVLGAAAMLLLLTAAAVWGARHGRRWLAVGWFWFLGTLVPTIGLVHVGGTVMADRFLYLPQIGLGLAVAWSAAALAASRPNRRWRLSGIAVLLLGAWMACAWRQTSFWQNSGALWAHTVACTPPNAMAEFNLGNALNDRGQLGEAIEHFRKSLQITPEFADVRNNLGLALANSGQLDEAVEQFHKALETRPDYINARNNLGLILAGCGHFDEAIQQFRKGLEIGPDNPRLHNNLGEALVHRGQIDEALEHFQKAVELSPDFAEAHNNLGEALARRGRTDEALDHFQKALVLAIAGNNQSLVAVIRTRIDRYQSLAPKSKTP